MILILEVQLQKNICHSSMQQIFCTPTQHQISTTYYDPCILRNPFTRALTYQATDTYYLSLNNSHIYIFDSLSSNTPKLCTTLEFGLKFEILREQWKDQTTPGKPIGITFQKDGCHPISFYSSLSVIEAWRCKLQTKINQRGFHKLFKAKKKIGKGAFATVYLAQRLLDKKIVAVKAFSKQKQYSGDKGRDSLVNEIQLLRKLRGNSHILHQEGVFETDNSVYVILEHLDGGQLHEKIKMGVRYSLNQVIKIMEGILRGLAYMDTFRIIHRDLKPQNLLFRTKDSLDIVVADFGLATWAEEPKYLFVRCGTPGFVAPQIINIKDMSTHSDPISDVFSAGLIFHYLLMGKSVFPGTKYADILAQNRACDIKLNGPQYDNVDPDVYDLLKKMLEVNPKLRIRAHQALNHCIFNQKMDEQYNNYEAKMQKANKQNCPSLFDSPKLYKRQTSASEKQTYKAKQRQTIILNNKYLNLVQNNS